MHVVFSTKGRARLIPAEIQSDLWAYLGGIARFRGMTALAVNGVEDHAHLLLSLPATMPLAKAVQLLKAGSSKWLNERLSGSQWQEGYGAFSIGVAQLDATRSYIKRQAEHHKRRDFQAEFLAFLKKHRIDYDPRYAMG